MFRVPSWYTVFPFPVDSVSQHSKFRDEDYMSITTRSTTTTSTHLQEQKLSGNMGVGGLVMNVLAFSSPLTTVAGTLPVMLLFSGHTAPGIYLLVTLMLLIFSVGFVEMSRSVDAPGGFYSFVTAGLGQPAGLGGALLALFGYVVIGFFAPSLFALTLQSFVVNTLNGPDISWYWYGLGIIGITTFLAYHRIDLSAKVLTVVMLLESAVVIVFDVAAFAAGSGEVVKGIGFSMPWITDAGLGLALLFAVGNFFGFEATVIYRDEVKNPDRTIPRATYIAVVGIGIFYAVAAWAYTAFLGPDKVQSEAAANTINLFNDGATVLVAKIFADVAVVLLITSILASMLSIQNIAARYSFSLAADGALPSTLGRVHPRHKSPFISALAVGLLWAVATVVFTILGVAPEALYPIASGSGTFAVLLLMFITSFAVLVYFVRRRRSAPKSVWKTIIAPAVSVIFLGVITYLAITNYPELIGGSAVMTAIFMSFTFALFIGGIAYACLLRSKRPGVYSRLGRQTID